MPLRWKIGLSIPPLGFVLAMIVMANMDDRDARGIPRALGLQGISLITLGLAVAATLFGRRVGDVRKCPQCKARWVEMERVGEPRVQVELGPQHGRFTPDGWKNGAVVTSSTTYDVSCRKCGHKSRGNFTTRRRS